MGCIRCLNIYSNTRDTYCVRTPSVLLVTLPLTIAVNLASCSLLAFSRRFLNGCGYSTIMLIILFLVSHSNFFLFRVATRQLFTAR